MIFRVGWLIAARLGLLTIALLALIGSVLLFGGEGLDRLSYLSWPFVFFYSISIASTALLRRFGQAPWFIYAQLGIDVGVVTGIVYVSGGPVSPFLFLYLPLVMTCSFLVSRRGALIGAAVCGLAYSLLVAGMHSGWIEPGDGSQAVAVPAGGLLLQVIGLCSAMVLIAVATSYLLRALRFADQRVAQSTQALCALSTRQSELINSIPRGIVTTDNIGRITSVNQAALELLDLKEEEVLGRLFLELLKILDEQVAIPPSFTFNEQLDGELELKSLDAGGVPLRISYHGRPIVSAEGEPSGMTLVFQDETELRSIEQQLAIQDRMARLLAQNCESDLHLSSTRDHFSEFAGESKVMQKVYSLIERVSPSDATVLIHGESGTGKELVARAIHNASNQAHGPFVPVNCGAIPENLIESELFGHRKGAFTGAHADSIGLFRQASHGTIFLDEIGELPISMQAKLLRSIQERTVRPVGGEKDIPVDVRIVAATNRNLKVLIKEGKFREDLFYRLNVIGINLPPLRERKDDIPLLVNFLLRRLVKNVQAIVPPHTMQLLIQYSYPGNVRELENILERAYVLGGEVILPEHLPENVRNYSAGHTPDRSFGAVTTIIVDDALELPANLDTILATLERRYLECALVKTSGAKKRAAELLGMNFRSFRYRLQKFGIGDE